MPRDQERLRAWRATNRDRIIAHQVRDRERYRREAIAHYGGRCCSCDQNHPGFLSLDHVDGGGTAHRVVIGGGGSVTYRWLAQQGYPDGYRVLCLNCNLGVAKCGQDLATLDRMRTLWRDEHRLPPPTGTATQIKAANKYRRLAADVISRYGGECGCCGEDFPLYLAIDHVEQGSGNSQRLLAGAPKGGHNFYRWLRRSGFPAGFRVLCHNCNFGVSQVGSVEDLRRALRPEVAS